MNNNSDDRRKNLRYLLQQISEDKLKCLIKIEDEDVKIKSQNLSVAGISFKLSDEYAAMINKNSSYTFKFILNNDTTINALGKLVWKTKIGSSSEDYYSMGFHLFISDEEKIKKLDDFLRNLE